MEKISDSILLSTEKMLGIDPGYEVFDVDIVMHINSVFMILKQLGVGPSKSFSIKDEHDKWSDFFGDHEPIESVKTYMYMKVRMMFDPPTGAALESMKNLIDELEWRLANDYTFDEETT